MAADEEQGAERPARPRSATGMTGENAAVAYLVRQGCRIVERNWRAALGEIDVVARCTSDSGWSLAFIEVRTRHGSAGLAEGSLSPRKSASMVSAAYAYMEAQGLDPEAISWRIDLVAVSMSGSRIVGINWVQSALEEP